MRKNELNSNHVWLIDVTSWRLLLARILICVFEFVITCLCAACLSFRTRLGDRIYQFQMLPSVLSIVPIVSTSKCRKVVNVIEPVIATTVEEDHPRSSASFNSLMRWNVDEFTSIFLLRANKNFSRIFCAELILRFDSFFCVRKLGRLREDDGRDIGLDLMRSIIDLLCFSLRRASESDSWEN